MEDKDVNYWLSEGDKFLQSCSFEQAINCFSKVIELNSYHSRAYCGLGIALSQLAKTNEEESLYREAFDNFDKAVRLEPNNNIPFSYWGAGLSLLAIIKKEESLFKESFEKFDKAIQLKPDDVDTLIKWGATICCLAIIKNDESLFKESFKKFDKATQLKPDNVTAFFHWGNALADLANIRRDEILFRESFEKYNNATKLDYSNAEIYTRWGCTLVNLANIKQDESLYRESFEKYAYAVKLKPDSADTFLIWGDALADLANIKHDISLLKKSFAKYSEATRLKPDFADAFVNWGKALFDLAYVRRDVSLFKESFDKYYKATQLKPDNVLPFNNWGLGLYYLAEIKLNDLLFSKEFELFEKTSQRINDSTHFFIKGLLYLILNEEHKAEEYLKKSGTSLLETFAFLSKENTKKIIQTKILYQLLDSDTDDGRFFKETTKDLLNKMDLDKYKKIYILSIFIISQLHVRNERLVAHYQGKNIAQKMLFDDNSRFRLNAINYSNDPTEGETLLYYLWGEEKYKAKEISNKEYGAFAGCFTLNQDSLNQFRLYGKEDNNEGVGVSLVFRNSFFSKEAKMAMKQEDSNFQKEEKYALFRCVYIDPIGQRVVTIGRKEEYLFYQEENISKKVINNYNNYISEVLGNIRDKMEELKKMVKGLDLVVMGQLLLNLRYLTKHVAFKEEQECRIVKICRLADEQVKISSNDDYKQMYIDYEPKVSDHIVKIYFGPKATGMELFQDTLTHKHLNIPCKRSDNPLA